jgi:hypothetical protein
MRIDRQSPLQTCSDQDRYGEKRHLQIEGRILQRAARLADDQEASGHKQDQQHRPDHGQKPLRRFLQGKVTFKQPPDTQIHKDRRGKQNSDG